MEEEESETVTESENELVTEDEFSARPYQVELLERAKKSNTIVCLGTGTGKTFISVMLIKELAHQVRESYKNGGKRTFFLVRTVPLAVQQAKVIEKHTDLKVKHYVGEMGVDFWDETKWEEEFNGSNVLVMTAQIFLDLLCHAYIRLPQVNLLIFDECHHAKKNDPYKQIMQLFQGSGCSTDVHPQIMGLTASIVNGKVKSSDKINSELEELECTLRSKCVTSRDEDVEKFAAKPTEEVLTFSNETNNDTMKLITILSDVLKSGINFLCDRRVSSRDESLKKFAISALKECQDTLDELGPWAANKVAGYLIKDLLDRACICQDSRNGQMFCEFSATQLRQLQDVYSNSTSTTSSDDSDGNGKCYIMPKLQKLLTVLKEYKKSQSEEINVDNTLCGIVFVERRSTALVLSEQINFAAKLDPELTTFIKSSSLIGHGTGGKFNFSNHTEMNFKKQEEVLRQFRRHEFNLLIATSVVEEGLDIPKCNVVFRYDFPNNYRSYVQSKGRARAKHSRYYMLVAEEEKLEKERELKTLRAIEEVLMSKVCYERPEPTEEECIKAVDTDLLPPYIPEKGRGARVTMGSSIPLLSKYCSKLPGDRFTCPKPLYTFEECSKGYICELQLPLNCQLREKILSPPMPRKNLAKMAAALFACKELHKIDELNDDLLPVCTLSDEESMSEEEEEEAEFGGKKRKKAGTKKRRRFYDRKVPEVFIGSLVQAGQPQFLTTIVIRITKLTRPQEFVVSERLFTDHTCMFGMLTNKRLPPVRSFKLYPDYGEVTVSLTCQESPLRISVKNQDLANVRQFHCFLFSHVLRVSVELKPESADGYYIVLVKDKGVMSVDFERMKEELRFARLSKRTRGNSSLKEDMVVKKKYADSRRRYAVLSVRHDLTPLSPFPDRSKGKTYEDYFRKRYGARVTNMEQPLFEVKEISGRVNFLVDRKSGSKRKRDIVCLIPELCDVLPFRSSLLCVSQILPSILQRVTSLLLVADVKAMVAGVRDVTDESQLPSIGANDAYDEKKLLGTNRRSESEEEAIEVEDDGTDEEFPGLYSDLKSIFCNSSDSGDHPDSALVLQALTTTHSKDAFNLERLEMLGDSFLKLAVSLHLFCTYKDKDEGKLTRRKIKQISNSALYLAAAKKSLAKYLQSTQLAPNVWCPTGCQFSQVPEETNPKTEHQAMDVDNEPSRSADVEMEVDDVQQWGAGDKRDKRKLRSEVGKESSRAADGEQVDPADTAGEGKLSATERARQKCNTQVIADKSVADSIEALIGAYLISCGYLGALKFMNFVGLKVLPERGDNHDTDPFAEDYCLDQSPGCYGEFWPEQTIATTGRDNEDLVYRMISGLATFEKKSIKYTFQSKLHLLEALTHASYHPNRITTCYQRLEFLGDALLDFLVTQHFYFRHAKLSPGQLTDIREALVNNNIFATIAVNNGYHKYLKQMSPQLFKTVENFINRVEDETEERKTKVTADPFIFVSHEDEEGFQAPKVLGDIFESVAGAVFLDSGMDLTKIWGVYYRMMKPYIDHYSVHIPLNPIRRVCEEDVRANFSEADIGGKIVCTLRVKWGEFVGKGVNKKIAKATAAKLAIEALEKKTTSQASVLGNQHD